MLLTGRKVGHISVERILGHGGMGAVYAGFDEKLARRVALKVILAHRLGDIGRSRLIREAQTLSKLDHPNICRIYDCLEETEGESASDILVLELIEGRTLTNAIRGGLSRGQRLRIARAIASALVAAHRAGIIHRDLKPDNVMLTPAGEVKVLDFGLARWVESENNDAFVAMGTELPADEPSVVADDDDQANTAILPVRRPRVRTPSGSETAMGTTVGTPVYMSPEQARGELLTTASDMYSFGLLLQVLFNGEAPYPPDITAREIIEKAARGESSPPRGVERDVRLLVQRLKSIAPSDRPTAAETERRLLTITEKPKRIAQRAAVAALVLATAAGAWKYTVDLRRERTAALLAETDARKRRADADGLVGFMLGDLRKKLEPVGKLDILDDVAARSLKVLSSVDREQMTPDELQRTATALDQLGEVRIAQGKLSDAMQTFETARVIAEEAVKRAPSDAEAQLTYATSHFWLGNARRLRGDLTAALAHMTIYRDVAVKLARRYPQNDKYQLESAYGYTNVGAIREAQGRLDEALEAYRMTRSIKAERATAAPADFDRQGDLAATLDKIGTVLLRLGELAPAREILESELAILSQLVVKAPENMTWKRRLGVSYSYLSTSYEMSGNIERAQDFAQKELAMNSEVSRRDATNLDLLREVAMAHVKMGNLKRLQRQLHPSLNYLQTAANILMPMVAKEPQRKLWHRDLAQTDLGRGWTLLALGRVREAELMAVTASKELTHAAADAVTGRTAADTMLLRGDAALARGDAGSAQASWSAAADSLAKLTRTDRDPVALASHARALLRLGRRGEAATIIERLDHIGYQHPDLEAVRDRSHRTRKT